MVLNVCEHAVLIQEKLCTVNQVHIYPLKSIIHVIVYQEV